MKRNGLGYMVEGTEGFLHIVFYADNIVRFAYSKNREAPKPTVAVIGEPVNLDGQLSGSRLRAGTFQVEVDPAELKVKVFDLAGRLLSEDRTVKTAPPLVEKNILTETGIYGNGEKYSWLNQSGTATANFNSDVLFHNPIHHSQLQEMHTAIPFFIGASPDFAYGIYFDNSFRTEFDFGKNNPQVTSFAADGGNLDYYFFYGVSVDEVVRAYGMITGTQPLPRKKYLGYQQSRYSYENQDELLAVAENLQRHDIPCDVLYLDIAYLDAYKVFTVNKERFRDFKDIIKKLKEKGFAIVVIINPGVKVENNYRVYEEGKARGFFLTKPDGEIYQGEVWPKPAAFPDFMRSEVRHWWGDFHRELLDCGVDGIWNDMNEPANFTEESGTLPEDIVHLDDSGEKIAHAEAHNLYGLMQTRATREALEKLQPDKRPFVLTRAAFAGSQRYAALWTGDNSSVWEHLECSIPMCLNLGLSGISFAGADVGGYRGDCSGELLVRWTQLGAFIPFFRNHSEIDTARQEPWEFNPEVLAITRKYICLRYQFITYLYNLMRENSLTGRPVMRPLFYHYKDDLNTYQISDQFLLGKGLMVCPVLRPGAEQRMVYLPQGSWYDYWTDEKLPGGRFIIVKAPLDKLPLFVKAGFILPQDDTALPGAIDRGETNLTMHCYAGEKDFCNLYFDDGATNNYRQGQFSEVRIDYNGSPSAQAAEIKIIRKGFPVPEIKFKIHGT